MIVAMGLPPALYNAVLPAWVSERFAASGQGARAAERTAPEAARRHDALGADSPVGSAP
jgi:hypothetical protein